MLQTKDYVIVGFDFLFSFVSVFLSRVFSMLFGKWKQNKMLKQDNDSLECGVIKYFINRNT